MGRVGKKTPRGQTETGPAAPDAEAAVAPASEVPEAPAEATAEQPDDDDPGGDSGAAAASSPAPEQHGWRADVPDETAAEDAGEAMVAPTQTMAAMFGNEEEESEEEDSEDDEDEEEQALAMAALAKVNDAKVKACECSFSTDRNSCAYTRAFPASARASDTSSHAHHACYPDTWSAWYTHSRWFRYLTNATDSL